MTIRVEGGDCLEVIPRLVAEGVVVDAVVTDPPYHLLPTVKRFSKEHLDGNTDIARRARKEHAGKALDDGLARLAGGFMGQQWDGGDVAFRPETWAAVATVLRPGGFLLAFGGTRTSHRVICAIEDAGFVIQDKIFWCFGSGFPKRRDMLKPAYEDICVAYKPGGKRTLQVDECKVLGNGLNGGWGRPVPGLGRWPANLAHSGDAEVMETFAACGQSRSARGIVTSKPGAIYGGGRGLPSHTGEYGFDDAGSPARFFKECQFTEDDNRFWYGKKADADDRFGSRHPTVKPVELLKWLVPLVTPKGGLVLDCFAGSGTTGVAALATGRNAILIEREDSYIADIRERLAHYEGEGRHSLAARNRNGKPKEALPLFADVSE